ncbi:MAG TPA: DUF4082 domain-containing protein, partial [Tepidisphaeraceae bacterium]|nr:DUF4082 domain-containing protein [Tepidisphaeraceae bacterium]
MPMRFATANGQMIDVYQVATQMTDESGQAYPATLKALLDKATGSQGYYGMFCANVHTDVISPPGESEIVTYARSQNVSIISSKQALDWADGRNGSSFQNLNWNSSNGTLSFSVVAAVGANGLQAMLPTRSASRTLRSITRNGIAVPYTIQTIKGIEYAFFAAGGDGYVASYDGGVAVPAISNVTATPRVYGTASVTWTTATAASSRIEYGTSPTGLDQTLSDPGLVTDHFLALSNLLPNTKYYYRITSTDSAGNTQVWPSPADSPASFISAGEAFSIWSSATPSGSEFLDGNPYELGVKFKASMDGYIAGIRFYKGPNNVGVHIGNLWDMTGKNLATATFASETADGWQTLLFSQPVAIKANTTYVASYHTNGNYWLDRAAFVSAGVSNGPLYALANGEQGANGVLAEGAASKFPTISANGFSYGVDVVFAQMADTTPPGVTSQTPAPNARNTPVNTAVTITFNEAVDPTTVTGANFQLTDGTAAVSASVSYNPDTYTVTLTPSSPLTNSTSYTAILSGVKDRAGNAMAGSVSWSFTTVAASIGGSSIWSDATVPSIVTQTDPFPYELGVKFKASMDGYIAGIRFYKGPNNVGEHIGNLWDIAGNNLATATFASETADGWQTVLFSQPVAIKANTTYVASYHTNGNYSLDWNTFGSGGVSNGPLYALANGEDGGNGVLAEGAASKFPTISANGRNYWVDVVFVGDLDTTPPSVTGRTPGIDATGVPLSTAVTVTFNEAVDPAT